MGTLVAALENDSSVAHSRCQMERLLWSVRVLLAVLLFVSSWLRPVELTAYWLALAGSALYLACAVAIGCSGHRSTTPFAHLRLVHVLDLAACALALSVSQGAGYLFAPFLVFAIVEASMRWQWQGIAWTSLIIGALFLLMGFRVALANGIPFAVRSLAMNTGALTLAMVLIGGICDHWMRTRRDLVTLLVPPQTSFRERNAMAESLAEWSASVVAAPRALIVWEEADEPWIYLAHWDRGRFDWTTEPPGSLVSTVPEPIADTPFLCRDLERRRPVALYRRRDGWGQWRGMPLHPDLHRRFAPRSVLAVDLALGACHGRLFLFDKPGVTKEDVAIAEVVARHVATALMWPPSPRRGAAETVREERMRLARDLHDGALHSLAGAALELERLSLLPTVERAAADERLRGVQQTLLEEQRNIRQLIDQLRRDGRNTPENLTSRLRELAGRLERQRGLRVECQLDGLDLLSPAHANEVYLVAHEALVNVARHAAASRARIEVTVHAGKATIIVADDGHGFKFEGRRDHVTLAAVEAGPVTLRERVALLGGTLTIESSPYGARLEIALNLEKAVAA